MEKVAEQLKATRISKKRKTIIFMFAGVKKPFDHYFINFFSGVNAKVDK